MSSGNLFPDEFFHQSAIDVAPKLLGASLCFKNNDGLIKKLIICETEAYHGTDDLASHASRGKNQRNQLMFGPSNIWYLYLCYGVHWMLNLVTDREGTPSAVFFRATVEVDGPGRLTKKLGLNGNFSGLANHPSSRLWLEKPLTDGLPIHMGPRIGISSAGPIWREVPHRFWFSKTT